MILAVAIPAVSDGARLRTLVAQAEEGGADCAVFAEPPLGDWPDAVTAAAFASAFTRLPIGIATSVERHPLTICEERSVLQRIVGPGIWMLHIAWSDFRADPTLPAIPEPLPFASDPWLVCMNESEVTTASGRGSLCLGPVGATAANGVFADSAALLTALKAPKPPTLGLLLTERGADFVNYLESVAINKRPDVLDETWLTVALEGFDTPLMSSVPARLMLDDAEEPKR
jgi:hypothetical protein